MYFSDIKIHINKGSQSQGDQGEGSQSQGDQGERSQSQGDQGEGDLIGDLNLYLLYLLYLDINKERAGASDITGRNRGYWLGLI